MAEVTIEEMPRNVQDIFNRAFAAFERKNYEYSIDLFTSVLNHEPGLLKARQYLRRSQIAKSKAAISGSAAASLTLTKCMGNYLKAQMLAGGKNPKKGMAAADKLLSQDPLHPQFVQIFATAAENAGYPEAAILTLEMAFERRGDDIAIAKRLAGLYADVGQTRKARECYERLVELRPNDLNLLKILKDAIAIDSMEGTWKQDDTTQKRSFRDIMKNSDEAALLEQESKAVKTDKDADALIADALAKLKDDPDNINYYRALGRLYAQQEMFKESIEVLQMAVERSPGDAELDRALSSVHVQRFDHELTVLASEGGDSSAIENLELERAQFVLDDLGDRVQRYPNDLGFKFDYGVALLSHEHVNEAIQNFQSAQRSPKHRTRALYHLSICFKKKKQYDMAAEQLQTALSEMPIMNENKKDVLYELGQVHELIGNEDVALSFYKQIYQVEIGYKDVAERVENRG
ncbi:MAG: tetratricopeptide (TPR) repeat protein [Candidatus Promineifilaceae bacterium]|jgi:tetratricopeptide (TPR) repeat protein